VTRSSQGIAFEYWSRRNPAGKAVAQKGGSIVLEEQTEYLVRFPTDLSAQEQERIGEFGADLLEPRLVSLNFRNFVGEVDFAGVRVVVHSNKIGPDGVSILLEEISSLSSSLIFGWRSKAGFRTGRSDLHQSAVPYHQLQFLRHAMLDRPVGERLQDLLNVIETNPTRRFESEPTNTPLSRVRRLDRRAIRSVASYPEALQEVAPGAEGAASHLARWLTFGDPPKSHLPSTIETPRRRLTFDTPENQFVRHAIEECLGLVYRFGNNPRIHRAMQADCRLMASVLGRAAEAVHVQGSGRLSSFRNPTQALLKADGYRDLYQFWDELTSHASLPRSAHDTQRLLEGRDVATLYEYWVFVRILACVMNEAKVQEVLAPEIERTEFGESLKLGIWQTAAPGVEVAFNPTFSRRSQSAYSTPLRPDVTLTIDGKIYAFDAKYRLDKFDYADEDDDGRLTYKRADLYKMHTYRDAIASLCSSCVVYPGNEFVFFERTGNIRKDPGDLAVVDGVGAVPLRPMSADPSTQLERLIVRILQA